MELEKRRFDFLSWLTGIVVMLYIGASMVALVNETITFKEFSAAVGPMAGLLLGYWVRGAQ